MLILIEGIDKSGKTTFINNFCNRLSLPFYRKNPPMSLKAEEYHSYFKGVAYALTELHNLLRFNVIVDRSFISDWVYSNKESQYLDFSIWKEWEERFTLQKDTILIYLEIPKNIFNQRINAQPDPFMSENDYESHMRLYEIYLSLTSFPYIRINGHVSFDEQIRTIISNIDNWKNAEIALRLLSLLNKNDFYAR